MNRTAVGIAILILLITTAHLSPATAQQGSHRVGLGLGVIFGDTFLDSLATNQEMIWSLETEEEFLVEGFYRYQVTDHLFVEPALFWSKPDVAGFEFRPGEQYRRPGNLRLFNVRANGGWVFNPGSVFEVYGTAGVGLVNWELEMDRVRGSADGTEFAFNFGLGGDFELVEDRLALGIAVTDHVWKLEPDWLYDYEYGVETSFRTHETTHNIVAAIHTTFSF